MSLTDLSVTLWQHPKLPVAAVVAQHAARITLVKIEEAQRSAFEDAGARLVGWWPERRKRSLGEVWSEATAAPISLSAELKGNARKAADVYVRALHLAAANLERVSRAKRELPAECYALEKEDFEAFLRDAIRLSGHTQVRDITRRLAVLAELADSGKWPPVVEAADRMGWTRLEPGLKTLPPRLRDLAEAIDLGGKAEIVDVGGRPALRVTMVEGARRIGVLSDEEMETLRAVVPWIPGPSA